MADPQSDLVGTLHSGHYFRLTSTAFEVYDEDGSSRVFPFPTIAGALLDGSQLALLLRNGQPWPLLLNDPADAETLGMRLAASAGFTLDRRSASPSGNLAATLPYIPYVPPPERDLARLIQPFLKPQLILPLLSLVFIAAIIIRILARLGPLSSGLLLVLIFPALVFAVLTGWIARQKGRATGEGLVLGFLFFVLGLFVELLLPTRARP